MIAEKASRDIVVSPKKCDHCSSLTDFFSSMNTVQAVSIVVIDLIVWRAKQWNTKRDVLFPVLDLLPSALQWQRILGSSRVNGGVQWCKTCGSSLTWWLKRRPSIFKTDWSIWRGARIFLKFNFGYDAFWKIGIYRKDFEISLLRLMAIDNRLLHLPFVLKLK